MEDVIFLDGSTTDNDDEDSLLIDPGYSGDGEYTLQDDQTAPNEYRVQRMSCNLNHFQCNNGQCIDVLLFCDGTQDCADGSDENQCHVLLAAVKR